MQRPRIYVDTKTKEARRRVDDGLEEHKATGAFAAEGPTLVWGLHRGGIAFGALNLCGWSFNLYIGCALGLQLPC